MTALASFANNLRSRAGSQPDAPAVTFAAAGSPDDTMSYAELDRLSNRVGHALAVLGVAEADRVAHVGRNRIGYPAVLYGVSKIKATLVGLNWRLTPGELAPLLADSRPRVIVADDEFTANVQTALAAAGIAATVVSGDDVEEWASGDEHDLSGRMAYGDELVCLGDVGQRHSLVDEHP